MCIGKHRLALLTRHSLLAAAIASLAVVPARAQYSDPELVTEFGEAWEPGIADLDEGDGDGRREQPVLRIDDSLIVPSEAGDRAEALPEDDAVVAPDDGRTTINAVAIEGIDTLDETIFAGVIESASGQQLTRDELATLTQQIADLAREEGYIFASAYIPEQALSLGILRVRIDEGRIDEIRVIGSDNRRARAILQGLIGARATRELVERKLLLVGDLPGVWIRKPRFMREDGRNVLEVEVRDRDDRGHVEADNYGTDSFGPVRARIGTDFYAVLDGTDHLELGARTNPVDPGEFLFASAGYSIGLGNDGARIGFAGSIGDTQTGFAGGDVDGDSIYAVLNGSYPILRSQDTSLWATATAAYLDIDRSSGGAVLQRDVTTTLSAGLNGRFALLGGRLRAGAEYTRGIDGFGATRLGDPRASRRDGDGVFSKADFWGSWSGDLVGDLGLSLSARGQVASRPLLSIQELSLGGAYKVRGYDFSELSGEDGFYALAELSHRWKNPTDWLTRLELYGFVDGGYVSDKDRNRFGGTLVSAGSGVRADVGILDFEVEAALPVNRDRTSSNDRSPHINVQVGIDF